MAYTVGHDNLIRTVEITIEFGILHAVSKDLGKKLELLFHKKCFQLQI